MPYSRVVLVSLSQNSRSGAAPSGPAAPISSMVPVIGCSMVTDASAEADRLGLGSPASQAQVLRNQAVGSTWMLSSSGPALVTWIVISRSSGPALA